MGRCVQRICSDMFLVSVSLLYTTIITAYLIISLLSAILQVQFFQHMYISILDRLFLYAASVVTGDVPKHSCLSYNDIPEGYERYDDDLIRRDIQLTEENVVVADELIRDEHRGFTLHHPIYLVRCGIEAIIEDSVTKRFSAAELRVWNFLGRSQSYVYVKKDHWLALRFLWFVGFFFRYAFFLPCRFTAFFFSVPLTWFVGCLGTNCPIPSLRRWILGPGLQKTIRFNLCPFSTVIRFHNHENRPTPNSICVANHTTPFDWCILASDNTYAVVGQSHSGFFGIVERIISAAVPAVWFDRDEVFDRQLTAKRLRDHVARTDAEPLLIFPEGTCINNTSVMKFKKGCFEIGAPIHPVAIKYNPLFADCFWNSSRDSLLQYIFKMMTSWAIVVDVWYLPPTRIRPDENGIAFARRVQQSIARCGGMLDIDWDGELKRRRPKDTLKLAQQRYISQYLVPCPSDET